VLTFLDNTRKQSGFVDMFPCLPMGRWLYFVPGRFVGVWAVSTPLGSVGDRLGELIEEGRLASLVRQ